MLREPGFFHFFFTYFLMPAFTGAPGSGSFTT
jgi:hypothetical protein